MERGKRNGTDGFSCPVHHQRSKQGPLHRYQPGRHDGSRPATDLYREIMQAHPDIHLIASGGVSNIDDIYRLDEAGIPAVVFGKSNL